MMRRLISSTALALATLSGTALAQSHPQTRDGVTIAVGVGGGSAGISCDECTTDRESAPSLFLNVGGAVRPNLILSGELNGWTKEQDGEKETIGFLTGVAQWYPAVANGRLNGSTQQCFEALCWSIEVQGLPRSSIKLRCDAIEVGLR